MAMTITRGTRSAAPAPDGAEAPRRPARPSSPHLVLAAALLSFFVISLDGSVVNVALPAIAHSLSGDMTALQWVVDGYTLMFAALMLSAGAAADRIGANRAYAVGLGAFTLASAACGLAPGLGALIGARMVQGAAAAIMVPTSLALIRQSYTDPGRRARAVAIWTAAGAVAVAIGPVAGGALTTAWNWQSIFFLNIPVGAVGLALLARIPRSPRRAAPLDLFGQLSIVVGLASLTYAVIEGGRDGFSSPQILATLAVSAVALVLFLAGQARRAQPMVPLGLLRSRTVVVCVAAGFALNAVFYGVIFLFGLYFQQMRGESAVSAGAMFVPMCGLIAVVNMASVKLSARTGPRVPMVLGQLIMGAGALVLLLVGPHTPVLVPVLLLVPVGIGGGLAVPSLTAVLLESVAAEWAGTAAAVLNTCRQVGGCLAIAVFGALIAEQASFQHGLTVSLVISGAMLAVTAAATLVLLPKSGTRTTT
ncbi:MFS transporter [Kitasatospora indigofera]|uniref:MFS transporter n=1 Tax=Kitasatospora indigofera TaxID=67307 RepID=A0A919L4S5_9ACTN|nr:MFS transporter [Kitasatospora indigofera]GHH83772.1 MFS transporter [Kitasatospora indigofera]